MYQVLIVDDMEVMRLLLRKFKLWGEETGFEIVEEAANGYEALDILKQKPIDLIISDIKMPVMDGLELVEQVTKNRLCPCIVLLSDYTDFQYARTAFTSGAFDYLGKPIKEEELSQLLERVKNHLKELQKNKEALKNLEVIADERLESIYPKADIQCTILHIDHGDNDTGARIARVVHNIYQAQSENIIMARMMTNKAIGDIVDAIVEQNPWISSFANPLQLKKVLLPMEAPEQEVIQIAVSTIETLTNWMANFAYHNSSHTIITQCCKFVLDNIDACISVKEIADHLFISKNYLSAFFKDKTGIPFTQYMTAMKVERAKKLITDQQLKNYEIALKLGYKDTEYFSKLFKSYCGISPSEYRQKISRV